MPITFDCACGKTLRVPDQHAGKRVRCPACTGVATVPEPEPMFEVVEDTSAPLVPSPPPKGPVKAKPVAAKVDEEDDRRGSRASRTRRDEDDEEEEEEERPRPKPKKKKIKARRPPRDEYDRSENNNSTSATREIIGGLIAMVIGGGLFLLVWANGRISIYGIILFVCGLIGLLKGLAGGSGDA